MIFSPSSGKIGGVAKNRIHSLTGGHAHGLDYFMYYPPGIKPSSPIVVSVHGYTRNAAEHAFRLAPVTKEYNAVLIVPYFTRKRFPHFNYLQPDENGVFPDDALDNVLLDVKLRLNMASNRVFLFGYSAGAQFSHRYLMLRGKRISKAALFAPGWYTWPKAELAYPQGLGESQALFGRELQVENLCKTDICVFVGDRDTRRDGSLNTKASIDNLQGKSRLERAKKWVPAINQELPAARHIRLNILDGVGHGFKSNISRKHIDRPIFQWLFEE